MRVMVIIKANAKSEAGIMPSEALLTQMGQFNEELVKAGVMLGGDGLKPSAAGVRVQFSSGKTAVLDGPFAETKELIAGYWIWQVKDMDEAVAWVKRIPNPDNEDDGIIEIRPFFEMEDFGEEFTPEARAQEDQLRQELERNAAKS